MVWILLSNSTGRRITKLKNYLVKIRACKSLPRIASCWSPAVHQRAEESVVGNKVFLRRSWRKINFASIRTEFSVDFLPLEKATTGKSRKRLLVVLSRTIHSPSFITLLDGVSQEGWVRFIDLQCEGKKSVIFCFVLPSPLGASFLRTRVEGKVNRKENLPWVWSRKIWNRSVNLEEKSNSREVTIWVEIFRKKHSLEPRNTKNLRPKAS